jgi:hypothetical protein
MQRFKSIHQVRASLSTLQLLRTSRVQAACSRDRERVEPMGSEVIIKNQIMVLFSVFDHCKELNFFLISPVVATCSVLCQRCRLFCDGSVAANCFATAALEAPGCTCQGCASEHCVSMGGGTLSSRCMRARLHSRMRGRVEGAGVYCALRLQLVNSVGEDGVGCIRGDAALVACIARHGDVSVQTPHIAPRVFDHVPGRGMKNTGGMAAGVAAAVLLKLALEGSSPKWVGKSAVFEGEDARFGTRFA